nr:MAG TPA: hypothetical protein [Caudoviricetes sp.]
MALSRDCRDVIQIIHLSKGQVGDLQSVIIQQVLHVVNPVLLSGFQHCIHSYLDIGVSPHSHKHINLLVYALRRVISAIAYCSSAVKMPPELLQLCLGHLPLIGRILKSAYGQQSVIVGHWDTFPLNSRLFNAHRSIRGMGGLSSALLR